MHCIVFHIYLLYNIFNCPSIPGVTDLRLQKHEDRAQSVFHSILRRSSEQHPPSYLVHQSQRILLAALRVTPF